MENEPENPVIYLSKLIKKLDIKKRNGILALLIINILVILFLRSYLVSTGLLS
tara:strand:+ start:91 stop:249 length:159 start_codon:yes stop_codon:yes gene_type:complete